MTWRVLARGRRRYRRNPCSTSAGQPSAIPFALACRLSAVFKAASIGALHPPTDYSFALKHAANALEFCAYVPFGKMNFPKPIDV
jgi:hypothetical protein